MPVREIFGLAAAMAPLLVYNRLRTLGFSPDQTLVLLAGLYLFIRYGLAQVFRNLTVHRGMWHSIPAMLIAGLTVFLAYDCPRLGIRVYLAGGVMLGFLSHLLLDELFSVGFNGIRLHLKQSAGSAFKFFSPSWGANLVTYALLAGQCYLVNLELKGAGSFSIETLWAKVAPEGDNAKTPKRGTEPNRSHGRETPRTSRSLPSDG